MDPLTLLRKQAKYANNVLIAIIIFVNINTAMFSDVSCGKDQRCTSAYIHAY